MTTPKPKPFTDEQAKYIREAAGLAPQADDEPTVFFGAAVCFIEYRLNLLTRRQQRGQWIDAQKKARQFLTALKPLPDLFGDIAELYEKVEEFREEAKRDIQLIDSEPDNFFIDRKPKNSGHFRPDVKATDVLADILVHEFRRLYEQEPTASPQGPFNLFADAYLEVLRANLPAGVSVKLPAGATLRNRVPKLLGK